LFSKILEKTSLIIEHTIINKCNNNNHGHEI
jgi:hypothetical protein